MQQASSRSETDAADKDFFQQLRRKLDLEISGYLYEHPQGSLGIPLTADQIHGDLNLMRLCLVDPRWEEVDLCNTGQESSTGLRVKRMCVTMAEDGDYVLVFDPVGERYHLACRSENGLGTWGIYGDGVGCFISR